MPGLLKLARYARRYLQPEHIANITKVRDYLQTLPRDYKHFDMGTFFQLYWDVPGKVSTLTPILLETECGSSACIIGHGPSAGIPPLEDEYWGAYCRRVFGVTPAEPTVHIWNYLFSPEQGGSHLAAIRRLNAFLKD